MASRAATATQTENLPFSRLLRESTLGGHDRAQQSPYMGALLNGALTLEEYSRLVTQYYFIYQAIEQVSDAMTSDPIGGKFVFDELRRMPALIQDLEFLVGPQWESKIKPLPATEIYVRRIHEASAHSPIGYVAHHYTRYLGDIAGGQVIRRLLQRKYGVEQDGALFYHFDGISSAPAFRDQYRALLDTTPWSEQEQNDLIAESQLAYECNIEVFADLARSLSLTHPEA